MVFKVDVNFLRNIQNLKDEIIEKVSRMYLPNSSKILMYLLLKHTWCDEKYLFFPSMKYWMEKSKFTSLSYAIKKLIEKKYVHVLSFGKRRILIPLNPKNNNY